MKHGSKYVPEPKKKKKGKEKSSKTRPSHEDEGMKGPFVEATNTKTISPQVHKRTRSANILEGDVEMMQTPAKRQRRKVGCADGDSDDDYEGGYDDPNKAPARRTRARAQAAEGACV